MVVFKDVSKWYQPESAVLRNIQLNIKKGSFLYVVGGSGAGKSTFLRMVATEDRPSMGSVSLFGYALDKASPSTLKAIRRAIGYIPQNIRLIPDLTVYENVTLSLSLAGRAFVKKNVRARVDEMIERVGLAHARDTPARAISGGEAQRVAAARALVRMPELIVADEPTGSQDRNYTWKLMDLFSQANASGATVVVATHDQEIVRRVPKPSAVLRGGRIYVEDQVACLY